MDRDAVWVLAPIGAACWMLGGTDVWPGKRWRRVLWPIIAGISMVRGGVAWYLGLALAVGMWGAHTAPYSQDRHGPILHFLIGCLCGLALAPGLYPYWAVILYSVLAHGLMLGGGLALSKRFNWFTHKWVEGGMGLLEGGFLAWALLH